ncbi:unnamed protein product [Blumeria hordei]|uniref:Uncharacterized protein n=1 Tax=Blumeria hordei TaxID=2867405 RepID=A0A383UJH1_BLUHO|nr:unnamed protein product [Blumeria hordei]
MMPLISILSCTIFFFQFLNAVADITLTGCHLEAGLQVCTTLGGQATTFQVPITSYNEITLTKTSPTTETSTTTGIPNTTEPPSSTQISGSTTTPQTDAVTACHLHGDTQYCVNGAGAEVRIIASSTPTPIPTAYTGCHYHGSELHCLDPSGSEVKAVSSEATAPAVGKKGGHSGGKNCHFHAGVEHCTSTDGSEERDCGRVDRDYNVNLRIGLLFVILITSAIGVFTPILLSRLLRIKPTGLIFTFIKQFGTGVIISTAFVHLLTHAELMFANTCLGELKYEATATSIAVAGTFMAFLVDFTSHRLAHWRQSKIVPSTYDEKCTQHESDDSTDNPPDLAAFSHHNHSIPHGALSSSAISLIILEAGIVFHSLLIGITLVVAGDSVFITLFVVIIFHQMFEGLALGARIAATNSDKVISAKLFILPLIFSFITPIGMAIGIGVLQNFNGNNPSTIIALGTLNAFSAGILIWVGFIEMWAGDWVHGDLAEADMTRTLVGMVSLIAGFILMGVLGKWA